MYLLTFHDSMNSVIPLFAGEYGIYLNAYHLQSNNNPSILIQHLITNVLCNFQVKEANSYRASASIPSAATSPCEPLIVPELRKELRDTLPRSAAESDEESEDNFVTKPHRKHEVGEVKKVADALRKISRPEGEITLHGEVKNVADVLRKISRPEGEIVLHPKPR